MIPIRTRWPALIPAAFILAACLPLLALARPAQADDALWRLLAGGGHVALVRHAHAPGTGDPAGFALGDCATQRNLDATGRDQARRLGERFRAAGIARARMLSSQWCRCLDTARLMDLGEVVEAPDALNSFFGEPSREPMVRSALLRLLRADPGGLPMVLVTHQVNVTAVTGIVPASGEIVVLRLARDADPVVVGRIPP